MRLFLLLPLLSLLLLPSGASAVESRPGHLLVGFSEEASSRTIGNTLQEADVQSVRNLRAIDTRLVRLEEGASRSEAIENLRQSGSIEFVEPDYLMEATVTPSDTMFGNMWGLHNTGQSVQNSTGKVDADIDAPEAWDKENGLAGGIVVGVADTGIDLQHGDLIPNLWANPGEIGGNGVDDDGNGRVDDVNGWNWVSGNANPDEDNYHGTHVAGTIAARGNNNKGVTGVSWGAKVAALKVLDSEGSGFTSDIASAAMYAGVEGMDVFNASLGGGAYSNTFFNALQQNSNVLYVFAAGNKGQNIDSSKFYPCSYNLPNVLCVGSTGIRDEISFFSNYGATEVDLAAPGESILSTYPQSAAGADQYAYLNGTSMAAPHVAGAAALLKQKNPSASVADVRSALMNGGDSLPSLSEKTVSGKRLNLNQSLDLLAPPVTLSVAITNKRDWIREKRPSWSFTASGFTGSAQCSIVPFGTSPSFSNCTSPFQPSSDLQEGRYEIRVRVQNSTGGVQTASHEFSVDTLAPAAPVITSSPEKLSISSSASFSFSGEEGATFLCALDGGAAATCTSSKIYQNLSDGQHTFGVLQTDRAGNISSEASYSWTIDTAPPSAPVFAAGTPTQNPSSIAFSGQAGVTFQCSLGVEPWSTCTSPWSRSLQAGSYTLRVRARDAAGNTSPEASFSFVIGSSSPSAPVFAAGTPTQNPSSISFSGQAGVTFQCSLGVEPWSTCTSPWSRSLQAGSYTLRVRAKDSAGQLSPEASFSFSITGPSPSAPVFAPGTPTQNPSSISFSGQAGVTFQCSLGVEPWSTCTSPWSRSLQAGSYTLRVRAKDSAGQLSPEASFSFSVVSSETPLPKPSLSGPDELGRVLFEGAEEGQEYLCAWGGKSLEVCPSSLSVALWSNGAYSYRLRIREGNRLSEETSGSITINDAPSPVDTSPYLRLLSPQTWNRQRAVGLKISWPAGTRSLLIGPPGGERQFSVGSEKTFLLPDNFPSGATSIGVSAIGLGGNILWQDSVRVLFDRTPPNLRSAFGEKLGGNKFRIRIRARDGHSGLHLAEWRRARSEGAARSTVINGSGNLPSLVRISDRAGNWSPWVRVQK